MVNEIAIERQVLKLLNNLGDKTDETKIWLALQDHITVIKKLEDEFHFLNAAMVQVRDRFGRSHRRLIDLLEHRINYLKKEIDFAKGV